MSNIKKNNLTEEIVLANEDTSNCLQSENASEAVLETRKIKRLPKRRGVGERITFAVVFVVFAAYSLIMLTVLAWALVSSFKTNSEFIDPISTLSLPEKWQFRNYIEAFKELEYNNVNLLGMFVNSAWYTIGSAFASNLMTAITGYVFAKYDFPAKKAIFAVAIFSMTIPIVGNLPSLYKIVYGLGLNDSPLFLLAGLGGFGGNFLIMNACFRGIDKGYAEACFIDGGGNLYCFTRIMLPMAKGPFFALVLMSFIGGWNNYDSPILFLDNMPMVASGLYMYKQENLYASNHPGYFAGVVLSMLPVVTLFIVFNDKIMNSVYMGGLKG